MKKCGERVYCPPKEKTTILIFYETAVNAYSNLDEITPAEVST